MRSFIAYDPSCRRRTPTPLRSDVTAAAQPEVPPGFVPPPMLRSLTMPTRMMSMLNTIEMMGEIWGVFVPSGMAGGRVGKA